MLAQIARRLLISIPVLFGVLLLGFGLLILVPGDPGRSLISSKTVISEPLAAIGPTMELMFACLVWSIPLGIAMGTLAPVWRGSIVDRCFMAISVAGVSLPIF